MLLMTADCIQPDVCRLVSGDEISVRTLGAGEAFRKIARQLDEIVAEPFGAAESGEVRLEAHWLLLWGFGFGRRIFFAVGRFCSELGAGF